MPAVPFGLGLALNFETSYLVQWFPTAQRTRYGKEKKQMRTRWWQKETCLHEMKPWLPLQLAKYIWHLLCKQWSCKCYCEMLASRLVRPSGLRKKWCKRDRQNSRKRKITSLKKVWCGKGISPDRLGFVCFLKGASAILHNNTAVPPSSQLRTFPPFFSNYYF